MVQKNMTTKKLKFFHPIRKTAKNFLLLAESKQNHLSQKYTTDIREILKIKCS